MKKKGNDFDSVAWIYDSLSKLVFGNELINAQKHFLHRIPGGSNVLIIGGGTGDLLPPILHSSPGCHVCYIDASLKMIDRAQAKVQGNKQVRFIHGTEQEIPTRKVFDVIITNFYFDLFSEESLHLVVDKVKKHLSRNGAWLATDFVNTGRIMHRAQLGLMYAFFRVISNIEASRLPEWEDQMKVHFTETGSATFRNGFIKSAIFQY